MAQAVKTHLENSLWVFHWEFVKWVANLDSRIKVLSLLVARGFSWVQYAALWKCYV